MIVPGFLTRAGIDWLTANPDLLTPAGTARLLPDGGAAFLAGPTGVQLKAELNALFWAAGAALTAVLGGGALSLARLRPRSPRGHASVRGQRGAANMMRAQMQFRCAHLGGVLDVDRQQSGPRHHRNRVPRGISPEVPQQPTQGHFPRDHGLPDGLASAEHGTDLLRRDRFAVRRPEPAEMKPPCNALGIPSIRLDRPILIVGAFRAPFSQPAFPSARYQDLPQSATCATTATRDQPRARWRQWRPPVPRSNAAILQVHCRQHLFLDLAMLADHADRSLCRRHIQPDKQSHPEVLLLDPIREGRQLAAKLASSNGPSATQAAFQHLIDRQSQNITVAARAMAERKALGRLSQLSPPAASPSTARTRS